MQGRAWASAHVLGCHLEQRGYAEGHKRTPSVARHDSSARSLSERCVIKTTARVVYVNGDVLTFARSFRRQEMVENYSLTLKNYWIFV